MAHGVLALSSQASGKKQKKNKTCKQLCSTKWNQMRLRSQIVLRLVSIIITLFIVYITVIVFLFETYYIKDVRKHFREELEGVHLTRTSNMTVGISTRLQAFDEMTAHSVGKAAQLTGTLYVNDAYKDEFPLKWDERDYSEYCTNGTSLEDQQKIRNLEPLWTNHL